MSYWEAVDHAADLASLYGVSQRRSILSAQLQLTTQQGRIRELLEKSLLAEEERAKAEETSRQEQANKLERQKNARKLLCSLEDLFTDVTKNFSGNPTEIVWLALVEAHTRRLEQSDLFESMEDLRAFTQFERRLVSFIGQESGLLKSPLQTVLEILPTLDCILAEVAKVWEDFLLLHPKYQVALEKDEELRRGILLRLERDYEALLRKAEANNAAFKFCGVDILDADAIGLWWDGVLARYSEAQLGSKAEFERATALVEERKALLARHDEITEEINRWSAEEDKLNAKYTIISSVTQRLSKRRKLFDTSELKALEPGQVIAKLAEVKEMSVDTKLEELQRRIPSFCLDSTTRMLNKAFVPIARLMADEKSCEKLEYVAYEELYDFLSQCGDLYTGLKAELSDIESFLQELATEYEKQCVLLAEVNDLLETESVFTAREKLKSLDRKFSIDYAGFDNAVTHAMQPYSVAQQLLAEIESYSSYKSSILGQVFGRKDKAQELRERLKVLKWKTENMPQSELRLELSRILAAAETRLG